jgi:hypothetical protein
LGLVGFWEGIETLTPSAQFYKAFPVKKFLQTLSVVVSFTAISACSSESPTPSSSQSQNGQQPGTAPSPTATQSQATTSGFQYFSVIREFGGNDTAALFGILPDHGTLQITEISGPSFLGTVHIGTFNQDAINHLFLKSSKPMSQQEKNGLIAKYNGAEAIYVEGYEAQLCTDSEVKIKVSSSFGDLKPITTFDFTAEPTATDDCTFHSFLTLTQD